MRWILCLSMCVVAVSLARAGENWTQFRGPDGSGVTDAVGLPVAWGEGKNVVWKTRIHDKGWASPVVWGEQVWLTTARADGTEFFAVCVDRNSGKVIHDIPVFTVAKPAFCHPVNSYASPTPVIEEGRVYVHFGTYGTACLDTKTGQKLWERRDLECNHFRGPGSSPIVWENLLFLCFDGFDVQYVAALDKATGKTVWKKDRGIDFGTLDGDFKKAYGTPRVVTVNDQPQLICPAATATTTYDPRTGEELWRVIHGGMNVTQPPQVGLGKVVLCTADGGLKMLAVRPEGRGDVTKTHIDWTLNKNVPSRSSPVLVDGLLTMVNEAGIASCVDVATGKVLWQERLAGPYMASPLWAEGRVYFFNENGVAHVGQAGKSWKLLATNKLDDGFMASPAVAGKSLFLRTRTHLYRVEEGAAAEKEARSQKPEVRSQKPE